MTRTRSRGSPRIRAKTAWYWCGPWVELQIVAPSARTSATPQAGPMVPCVCTGQR